MRVIMVYFAGENKTICMKKNKSEKKSGSESKPKKNRAKRMKKSVMARSILSVFQSSPKESFNYKQISKLVGVESHVQKIQVANMLQELAAGDVIKETDRGRYRYNGAETTAVGVFRHQSRGKNLFLPEDGGEPVPISSRSPQHAMDGDKVKVRLFTKRRKGTSEAEIVEILERGEKLFVGRLQMVNDYAFFISEDRTLENDIFIPRIALNGGKGGDKVVVRITRWPDDAKNPQGEVVDVLGVAGDNTTEMHAILAEFGLPYSYPENVEKAAGRIADTITAEEIARREDFRSVTTFTIDPRDAKDFDDALSVRRLKSGLWEVGVHIADVTHYVRPESLIDREAASRATSVYLVDRTIPMLPERLCNEICSLRPEEEKLCFSVVFHLDEEADVKQSRIVRTVIRSDRRFTYEEAQQVIETGEGDFKEEILTLDRLAKKLRERRFQHGAVNFDRYEVRFEVDENGKPISTYIKESKDANKLVEEFMLLANRTVAEFVGKVPKGKTAKTFVYRVHDLPDPDKLESFATFVRRLGYRMDTSGGSKTDVSRSLNRLLDAVHDRPEEDLIEKLAIRSMQKARYTTDNIGHYGLAFDYYTHFTSPIRRYPDMMVHRLLERYLHGGRSAVKAKQEEMCEHCSTMEQVATNAERASIKYKQVEFLQDKIGMTFGGVISGVTDWGLYVELDENKCEGLVPIHELDGDYYEMDEETFSLVGRRSGRRFRLGDKVTVKVAGANLERRQLDYLLVE